MARPTATPETRSVRLLKVGEQVRHVISEVLTRQQVHDEVLSAHAVSVTGSAELDLEEVHRQRGAR